MAIFSVNEKDVEKKKAGAVIPNGCMYRPEELGRR